MIGAFRAAEQCTNTETSALNYENPLLSSDDGAISHRRRQLLHWGARPAATVANIIELEFLGVLIEFAQQNACSGPVHHDRVIAPQKPRPLTGSQ